MPHMDFNPTALQAEVSHPVRKSVLCHKRTTKVHSLRISSMISTFVVHCLDSIALIVALPGISRLQLAQVLSQASLSLTW